jgi:hypothetical protein
MRSPEAPQGGEETVRADCSCSCALFHPHALAGASQRCRPPRQAACQRRRPCVRPSALNRSRVSPTSRRCNPPAKSSPLAQVRVTSASTLPSATARRRASAACAAHAAPHRR